MITKLQNDNAPVLRHRSAHAFRAQRLRELLPPHRTYVEAYSGRDPLLFAKQPSRVEVVNDLDTEIWNLFKVLRDESDDLAFSVSKPYTHKANSPQNDTTRASEYLARVTGLMGLAKVSGRANFPERLNPWLMPICRRLRDVQVEHLPVLDLVDRYDSARTVFFIDPPELAQTDLSALINAVRKVRAKVMLCGATEVLQELLAGWRQVPLEQPRQSAWMNYGDLLVR